MSGEQLIVNGEDPVGVRFAVSFITRFTVSGLIRTRQMQLELAHCTTILLDLRAIFTANTFQTQAWRDR